MEYNISDLLDNLREVNVDIRPHTIASESRIKELTMKKIHQVKNEHSTIHGLGFIGKLLVAALVITALAIPVLAASGVQFTDWIEGIIAPRTNTYDGDLLLGSGSMHWKLSDWVVNISAEDTSNTGLTFVCKELGNPEKSGVLTTTAGYWLEKWNGTKYVLMDGTASDCATLTIASGATERWHIDWTDIYGELASGSYRIGKTFTYTSTDGKQEQAAYYAKFRIFTEEMAPLLELQTQGCEELQNRETYHLSWIHYSMNKDDYAHRWVTEVWKYGDNYLRINSYYNEDGSLKSHSGCLLRDGVGYTLCWEDGNVFAQVTEWLTADWVEADTFELYFSSMEPNSSILGEAWEDGNTLYFLQYSDGINEADLNDSEIAELNKNNPYWNHDYTEFSYTFDDSGRLCHMQLAQQDSLDPSEADTVVSMEMQVYDTAPEEIQKIIESQNVSDIPSFSWAEEQAQYADIAMTDDFVNGKAANMDDIQDVINRARKEADPKENPHYRVGYEYNVATARFDEATQMWRVEFRFSQDDSFVLIVYMDSQGITQMLVYP